MVIRMMTLRMLVVVISPSWPPSPSCPPPLQAPPAALGPAVLPAAGRVPLWSPFSILLLLLLAAPPAHHLWQHFSCLSCKSPPFLPAALLHILLPQWPTEQQREAGFWFSGSDHKWPRSRSRVYLFTILSLFFLTSGFGWCIACSSSPCSSSLPARLSPSHALLYLSNLSPSPLKKSNQLFTALISELKWAIEGF